MVHPKWKASAWNLEGVPIDSVIVNRFIECCLSTTTTLRYPNIQTKVGHKSGTNSLDKHLTYGEIKRQLSNVRYSWWATWWMVQPLNKCVLEHWTKANIIELFKKIIFKCKKLADSLAFQLKPRLTCMQAMTKRNWCRTNSNVSNSMKKPLNSLHLGLLYLGLAFLYFGVFEFSNHSRNLIHSNALSFPERSSNIAQPNPDQEQADNQVVPEATNHQMVPLWPGLTPRIVKVSEQEALSK